MLGQHNPIASQTCPCNVFILTSMQGDT